MKKTTLKRNVLVLIATVIAATIAFAIVVFINGNVRPAKAETYNSADDYNFTLVTDDDGNSSYKVAIKTTLRNTATVAIVPDTYNDLPATELANNAFASCKKLTKVILPKSITAIGTSAFINCTQLKLLHMPSVVTIGANAFSMCGSLDRLYIPKTVKSVGANILRNNAKTVYVQSAAEDLDIGWSSSWNDYHTGEVVYSATPEDSISYREVYNKDNTAVIGYEICEEQTISTSEADVVIYNAYRPNEESEYLPVLNICQGAFSGVTLKSLTIKDRPDDDASFPVFDHKINIRSNAFFFAFIDNISIETDVTFDHPTDLQVGSTENMFGDTIEGNADGQSVGIFEEALMLSVTLPSSLDGIYDNMFYNCTSLKTIKIAGQEYDGKNRLPEVKFIGDGAFSSCGCVENLFIPSTVEKMGDTVFFQWGSSVDPDTHKRIKQEINIDFYEKKLPSGWKAGWAEKININNVTVNYKTAFVTVDVCNEKDEPIVLSAVPEELLPNIDIPTYTGHIFKGVYSERNGEGVQYYTSDGVCVRKWYESDPAMLYADWGERTYSVNLESDGTLQSTVNVRYGEVMPAAGMPTKRGYDFKGYYYLEPSGTKTFYYNSDMSSAKVWDRDDDCTLQADWEIIEYTITYDNLQGGTNPSENPLTYTVNSKSIVFFAPSGRKGYEGSWDTPVLEQGSVGDKKINAIWTPIEYSITYVDAKKGTNPNSAITFYTVETPTIVFAAPYGVDGYRGRWSPASIPQGSIGNIAVEAEWAIVDYYIEYKNLLDGKNPNTLNLYSVEDETIVFAKPYGREGYIGDWDIKEIPKGSTGRKEITAIWTPIKYTIKFENLLDEENPNKVTEYTIEDETIVFAKPYGRECYVGDWDIKEIPKGSTGNKKITAVWTPKKFTITYSLNAYDVTNNNPATITCEDVVELSSAYRTGYMLIGWQLDGKYVEKLANIKKDITLVAVWSDGKIVNVKSDMDKLVISADNMTLKLPSANFSTYSGLCIYVKMGIQTLTISSDYGLTYSMYIDLRENYLNFTLVLDRVKMISPSASIPTISKPSAALKLNTTGECGIYGQNSRNGNFPSDTGLDGGVAIMCNDLDILRADNLTIRGGNGGYGNGHGGKGGDGNYAIHVSGGVIEVYTDNVTLIGGNGGNALSGATSVGSGASAANKTVYNSGYWTEIIQGSNGVVG